MIVGVNFDGLKVELEVGSTDTIKTVIRRALSTIFPPESLPPVNECAATLCGEKVSHRLMVEELPELEGGHLLVVTLPF